MSTWQCPGCGFGNAVGDRFCRRCGYSTTGGQPAPGAPPPPFPGQPPQPGYPPQQGYPQQPGMPPQYPQGAPGYPQPGYGYPPQGQPQGGGGGKVLLVGCVFILLLTLCCIGFGVWGAQTHESMGTVASAQWERRIDVEEVREVREESSSEPPLGARDIKKEHNLKLFVDKNGKQIEKYEDKYSYTIDRNVLVRTETLKGTTETPAWPPANLKGAEKEGKRHESYKVDFGLPEPGKVAHFEPKTAEEYMKYPLGSKWKIESNNLGQVTKVLVSEAGISAEAPEKVAVPQPATPK